jgi:hypothetical protein
MIVAGCQSVARLRNRNIATRLANAITPAQRSAAEPESATILRAKPALTANAKFAAATRIRPAVTASAMTFTPKNAAQILLQIMYVASAKPVVMEVVAASHNAVITAYAKIQYVITVMLSVIQHMNAVIMKIVLLVHPIGVL